MGARSAWHAASNRALPNLSTHPPPSAETHLIPDPARTTLVRASHSGKREASRGPRPCSEVPKNGERRLFGRGPPRAAADQPSGVASRSRTNLPAHRIRALKRPDESPKPTIGGPGASLRRDGASLLRSWSRQLSQQPPIAGAEASRRTGRTAKATGGNAEGLANPRAADATANRAVQYLDARSSNSIRIDNRTIDYRYMKHFIRITILSVEA